MEDDAALVVSELVGNAVRHAGGVCSLDLSLEPDGLDIDVSDSSPETPRPRATDTTSEGGRGWGIVARLTSELSVQGDGRGKTVHAHIDQAHWPRPVRGAHQPHPKRPRAPPGTGTEIPPPAWSFHRAGPLNRTTPVPPTPCRPYCYAPP
ncbi:ATP-binding protein [Streptomyces sp. NPDC004266]|uniref:ATP-binding protein n=1 Tax=Streptomyces sp. NPDC004266 TaxID=3364693 RepID=UPI0036AC577D